SCGDCGKALSYRSLVYSSTVFVYTFRRAAERQLVPAEILHDVGGGAGGVAAHRAACRFRIAAQDRAGEQVVLLRRAAHAVLHMEEYPRAERREPLAQLQGQRLQVAVARRAVDGTVESLVQARIPAQIPALHRREALAVKALDGLALRRARAQRTEARAQRLELRHGLEHVLQAGDVDDRHREAAPRLRFHEAGGGEVPQRVTDRAARDLEAL